MHAVASHLLPLALLFTLLPSPASAQPGSFRGDLVVKALEAEGDSPEREMQLLEEFCYIDSEELEWCAPEEWVVDGASIPRPLWTLVGAPFVGNYRRASVVHDYYCDVEEGSSRAVHWMFYEAMLTGGVSPNKARRMYAGVLLGGPNWDGDSYFELLRQLVQMIDEGKTQQEVSGRFDSLRSIHEQGRTEWARLEDSSRVPSEEMLGKVLAWIEEQDMSAQEIDELAADLALQARERREE